MSKRMNTARVGAALVGVGAIVAASVIPGTIAVAEETGNVSSSVTRAVQALGDANGEISKAILVTQMNLDGNGTAQFSVPVAEGSSPRNMDSFGSPEVVDGSAQYNVQVDGPQTFRTSQDFNPDDIPVKVSVSATLDGQPISPTDLAGQSGLAKLTYTFDNTTSEPTQITYKDARGRDVTEDVDVAVPMGASVVFEFPESWQEISAPTAQAVSGNGQGATQVQGSVALLPSSLPGQSTTGTFEIEGRVTNAVIPPADIKVAVLDPAEFPDISSKVKEVEGQYDLTVTLTDAGDQLYDGAGQLKDGLSAAVAGANKLNDAVAGQLGPGVAELSAGLNTFNDVAISTLKEEAANLPQSVTSDPSFSELTDGFNSLRDAVNGVREGLGQYKWKASQKPGQYLYSDGDVDKDKTDVARTLWALVYGVRQKDVPTDSKHQNTVPKEATGGLTNPDCDIKGDPLSKTNPCGAWQVANALKGGLEEAADTLKDPKSGGAFAFQSLADALGCKTETPPGYNGPVVPPLILSSGQFGCTEDIYVGGTAPENANCASPLGGTLPCRFVINAVLGGYDLGAGVEDGLTQSLYKPLYLPDPGSSQSGLVAILGTYMPFAISELLGNITTDPNGVPDLDTSKKNTATGTVMQTRASLAQGGIGKDGYPAGRCEGYNRTGVPSSGINKNANPKRVEATCAAGDVLQIAVYGADAIEEGVSTTLLEGISAKLLEGVGTYFVGCEPTSTLACAAGSLAAGGDLLNEGVNLKPGENLVYGVNALAEGLPAAVDGAGQIQDAGTQLGDSGNDNSKKAGSALAIFEAMQARVNSGAGIPGGAPVGVDHYNGVYAFAFDGAGGTATENAARAGLGFLALIAAGGVGALLANRATSGG